MLVAEVDHGSDTATATISQSAMRASLRPIEAGHPLPRACGRAAAAGCSAGQAALRANVVAGDDVRELAFVLRQRAAVGFRVPQMQDAGREHAVLALARRRAAGAR